MTRGRVIGLLIVAAFALGPIVLTPDQLVFAGDLLVFLGGIAGVLFVGLYAATAPFWKSEEGTHLMAFTAYLTAVLVYVAVTTATRTADPSLPLARAFIFGGLAALMIWRLSILIRAQIRHRRRLVPAVLPIVPAHMKEHS